MINKVLFLMEKYCDADPKCGPSASEHQVVGAIESTGLVCETKHFYFDVLSKQFGQAKTSELLLEDCIAFAPDLIIYTPLGGALGDQLNPLPQAIRQISDERKLLLYLFDATPGCGLETKWLPQVNYLAIVDYVSAFFYYKQDPKIIMAYMPVSPKRFYDMKMDRDIDVCFMGTLRGERQSYVSFLINNGVKVFVSGGQRQNTQLTVEEYASIYNRSKISLTFVRSLDGIPALRQRVFETAACGSLMLVEDWENGANKFFEPNRDFVIFHDQNELLKLTEHYLVHGEERGAIAQSAWDKATRLFNATNMWGYVFERLGFKIPEFLVNNGNYLEHKRVMDVFYD